MRIDILAGIAFFILVFLFCAIVVPIAIDREMARMDAVAEYNCKHYNACGNQ